MLERAQRVRLFPPFLRFPHFLCPCASCMQAFASAGAFLRAACRSGWPRRARAACCAAPSAAPVPRSLEQVLRGRTCVRALALGMSRLADEWGPADDRTDRARAAMRAFERALEEWWADGGDADGGAEALGAAGGFWVTTAMSVAIRTTVL